STSLPPSASPHPEPARTGCRCPLLPLHSRGGVTSPGGDIMPVRTTLLALLLSAGALPAGPKADEGRELLAQLGDRDIGVRQAAARELTKLGPQDGEAVPVLVASLNDPDENVRQAVTGALARIGKPAVPALTKSLSASEPRTRRHACLALGQIGPDARAAPPALATGLTEPPRGGR